MEYFPRPIATEGVTLAPDILELTERLAENAHDVWALERMAQGWTYGPTRDDDARKHPCLVPYAELSEAEKRLDRQTAMRTLQAIIALGYRLTRI